MLQRCESVLRVGGACLLAVACASEPIEATSESASSSESTSTGAPEATTTSAGETSGATSTVDDGEASSGTEGGDAVDPACVPLGIDKAQYGFDDDVPASPDPPGGLAPEQVPMFVTIGWDDNAYSGLPDSGGDGGMTWATEMLAGLVNPVGTGNPLTFDGLPVRNSFYFTTTYIANPSSESPVLVKRSWRTAMEHGHEVGNHTHLHLDGTWFTVDQWNMEIASCLEWLTKPFDPNEMPAQPNPSAGIGASLDQIHGFRAPFLAYNDAMLGAVASHGFWYDCSIEEGYQPDQDGTNYHWPFTLDDGSPGHDLLVDWGTKQPIEPHPGLWELPVHPVIVPPDEVAEQYGFEPGLRDRLQLLHAWFSPESGKITGFDYNLWVPFAMTKEEFVATLSYTLDLRLQGNRAPFMFGGHTDIYSSKYVAAPNATAQERREAIEAFLAYALSKPDVRIVSMKDILDWVRDPVPLGCPG